MSDKLYTNSGEHKQALADVYSRAFAAGLAYHGNSAAAMQTARAVTRDFNALLGY